MPQVLEQGDIFGRIGKNVGQGFGEGAQNQSERSQLANQAAKIPGFAPEAIELLRSPGGRELLPTVLPYLQERGASKKVLEETEPASIAGGEAAVLSPQQQKAPVRPERLTSNPEDIRRRAAETQLKNPLAYPTLQAATAFEANRVANQEKQIGEVRKDFDEILSGLTQKGGTETYRDVLGELQEKFREQAEDAVLSGKLTSQEAAREFGTKALNFAKARNKFTLPGRDFWRALTTNNPLKEVRAAKKAYDDAGVPEAFLNDLVAKRKFSLPVASAIAFPPSPKAESFFKGLKYSGRVAKEDPKVFDKVLELLSPKDSLQAFAAELNRKGYSPQAFLDHAASSKKLEPFQERELQNQSNFQPSLSDVLYFTMSGRKP